MTTFRSVVSAFTAAILALVVACAVAAALEASAAKTVPVAKLTAKLSPRSGLSPGTPVGFALDTRFASRPPGRRFVLRRVDYLFPRSVAVKGGLFPSCSVRRLVRARNELRACPRGSRIGRGIVSGRAVSIDVISRGRLTLFNGPGGRSVTINVQIETPALINKTVSAPLRRVRGSDKLRFVLPPELNTLLDGDIVTTRVQLALKATRMIRGAKRGYIEAGRCPSSGKAQLHGAFTFRRGVKTSADAKVAC